ncbi:GerMN domain-containing protein [Lederbergia citrea]|uniref:GerMN domain-containing protein n=1 Tax=Lederbergia citrea TaxID=2833581 RepID=A0A942Z4N7_9BACI|nr:GerMN domain-containing protein [Lederbergia citrea]MBS4176160.1 GerMN domain-containing protein [Lederbergia citrea]MBS4202720.1 GerMN domain-containing protein [Lederbergia citrea]MBS4222612.1 GerMN domain-containing protein [Lederbergia citrea]
MSKRSNVALTASAVLAASMFLSGCGLFGKEKESLDPPKEVSYLKEGEKLDASPDTETAGEEKAETVMQDVYLIDRNGLVVAQTLPLPKTESVAKQALRYLVADGPVTDILPNGFRTVLPAGTEVDVDIDDGKAVVDFSEEFSSYDVKDEKKILQAVTWTLTQFDSVKTVELRVNGYPLTEMPVGKTPISPDGLSRADGINTENADAADITNTRPVTVYYLAQGSEDHYYVPVTRRIANTEKDDVVAVINQLVEGPGMQSELISALMDDVKLMENPKIENGNVVLNFNEAILGPSENKVIADATLRSIVLSLTEQPDIESVSVMVDGSSDLVNEEGESLTAPVTRPEKVNTGSF